MDQMVGMEVATTGTPLSSAPDQISAKFYQAQTHQTPQPHARRMNSIFPLFLNLWIGQFKNDQIINWTQIDNVWILGGSHDPILDKKKWSEHAPLPLIEMKMKEYIYTKNIILKEY